MFGDNNHDMYRDNKSLNYNEVLVGKVFDVESNDQVR